MSPTCRACNSEREKKIFTKKKLSYYRCSNCGLTFLSGTTNPNYSNQLNDFEPAYLSYFAGNAASAANHEQLFRQIKKYSPGKKLLDVGCGSGLFVRFLRSKNWDAQGIEPSVALYTEFLQQDSFFFNTVPEQFATANNHSLFDVITAMDVIEHTEDPVSFLKSLYAMLTPGGYLFISTPDTSSIHQRVTGKYWHYYNRYHLSLFPKKTLTAIASKMGFVCKEAIYRGRYFTISYLTKYFRNFLMGKKNAAPDGSGKYIRLNLFDNRYYVFQKK